MPSDAERLAGVGVAVAAVGITTAASVYASRPGPKRWTRWLVLGGAAAAYGAYSLATWLEDQKNATAHGGDGDARDVDAAREKPAEDPDGGIGASSEISADPDPPARRSQMDQLLDAVAGGYDDDDDDDDDLDAAFDRAAKTVASTNRKLTNDQKLRVYALFKQSTVGANDTRKPRLLEGMAKHAKWSAWNELGDMPRDDAKAAYIDLVTQLCGNGNERGNESDDVFEDADEDGGDDGGLGGPVFSKPQMPFDLDNQSRGAEGGAEGGAEPIGGSMDPMLDACRRGDVAALQRAASFGPLDLSREDECGRTALHWAADGGHVDVAIALIKMGAHVDAVDDDGQTALHYAATCERAETCRLLLESGADPDLPDADGDTPSALGAVGLAMRSPGAD
jgi:acyl-CoA-binding protein